MQTDYIAHINGKKEIQTVKDHCENVATMAAKFASVFDASEIAYKAGLLHDVGKYSDEFQEHIINSDNRLVDHSTAGAMVAAKKKEWEIALAVAGHHSGIPDFGSVADTASDNTLLGRIHRNLPDFQSYKQEIDVPETELGLERFRTDPWSDMFFVRMIYSCLVDADYLDTETFVSSSERDYNYNTIEELKTKFDSFVEQMLLNPSNKLNAVRSSIMKRCAAFGKKAERGMYKLALPTGAGKTLDTMAFALENAIKNNLRRIIIVIPYTSIIDQNAEVYKKVFGNNNVLEHHSDIIFEENDECDQRMRMASENWDAPIVITTAVQFFESLYASSPSKCRKLHNIANGVVVIDEAQMMPVHLLKACLLAIRELKNRYKCSVVLSTATQPPFEQIYKKMGIDVEIDDICEVRPEEKEIFERCEIVNLGNISYEEFLSELDKYHSFLVIVNTKKAARDLFESVNCKKKFCLTTNLTPNDRRKMITEIKRALQNDEACRVFSTSLVEAGVDLDFPTVFREISGYDSIIQSAGRCNREGKGNKENSKTYFFKFTDRKSNIRLEQNIVATEMALSTKREEDIEAEYFRYLWSIKNLDKEKIIVLHNEGIRGNMMPFREIDSAFKLIGDETTSVCVPFDGLANIISAIKQNKPVSKKDIRRLKQNSVNVYRNKLNHLVESGVVEIIGDMFYILSSTKYYDSRTGLNINDSRQGSLLF